VHNHGDEPTQSADRKAALRWIRLLEPKQAVRYT